MGRARATDQATHSLLCALSEVGKQKLLTEGERARGERRRMEGSERVQMRIEVRRTGREDGGQRQASYQRVILAKQSAAMAVGCYNVSSPRGWLQSVCPKTTLWYNAWREKDRLTWWPRPGSPWRPSPSARSSRWRRAASSRPSNDRRTCCNRPPPVWQILGKFLGQI